MNKTEAGDLEQNLFTLFARQAARRPDAIAVIDDVGATTYGALLTRACIIANALTQHGLGAEQPVGVLMKRRSDLLATLLGILGAGGCYVPLDPEDPPERIQRTVKSAKCQLVLGHKLLLDEFGSRLGGAKAPADTIELIDVDRYAYTATIAADPRSRLPNPEAPGGHRLAYILFTSGSTGAPKGVEVEHRNVVNLLLAARDLFRLTESDRGLATATIAFDLSVAELLLPLITGASLVLRDRRLLQDPRGLVKVIRDHGVTLFQTVPSVWSVLLSEIDDFPRLRVITSNGEAVAPDLARRLVDVADEVWNMYGPTETTVWATGRRLQKDDTSRSPVSAPIGRPLVNMEARVLDEHRAPVPSGTEGELWIGGSGVGRGYRGNEQLTRERFVDLAEDGRKFYWTGDVVVADPDGTLHYFGRSDDQMKIRGVRIEPMEVESAILTCPGVAQAAATWYPTASGSRSIVAAVVAGPHPTVKAEDIHRFLMRVLPSGLVPSRFVFCDALPMTPSGKVDRKAIRARVAELPADAATPLRQEELTMTEAKLVDIWERTLKVRPIARSDHFFSIGGDSLSAVTMMLEVEATFGISLAFRVAFEAPTLKELAERVDRAQAQRSSLTNGTARRDDLSNAAFVFPLAQQGRGIPVFFNGAELKMANQGMWNLDCPLYCVSQWAQGSGFAKAKSVEELARVQIDGIRSVQPHGPYRLAGYSFGGVVALEIAQQLRRVGEKIELLFLLDPSEPFAGWYSLLGPLNNYPANRDPESTGARFKRHGKYLAENPQNALGYIGARALNRIGKPLQHWINYHLVHFYGRHPNAVSARLLPKNRWPAFWHSIQRVARTYNPQPYDGAVLAMFISHQERRELWQQLLGPTADIRTIDSHHLAMFTEPTLSLWLEPLRARLEGTS